MSLFVKICGLRDAAAIDAALEAGADALGFVFADSPRRIDPRTAAALTRNLGRTVVRVAVTRHPDAEQLSALFGEFQADYLQTDAEDFAAITLPPHCRALPVYRNTHSDPGSDPGRTIGSAGGNAVAGPPRPQPGARILFEGAVSGSGTTADWQQAAVLARDCELILAGGLSVDNVAAAIAQVRPWGVDVSSGVERERGIKDPGKIREFIARARAQETTGDNRRS